MMSVSQLIVANHLNREWKIAPPFSRQQGRLCRECLPTGMHHQFHHCVISLEPCRYPMKYLERCETIRCRRRKIVSQGPVPKSLTCQKTPRDGFVRRIDIHRLAYPSDAEPTLHLLQDGEHLRHSVHVMM